VHLGRDLAQLLLVDTGQGQRRLVLLNTSLRRQTLSLASTSAGSGNSIGCE
jgi:hypothetical protein